MNAVIRVGTGGGELALAQSKQLAARVAAAAQGTLEFVPITGVNCTGELVAALRSALLNDECDLVVHSVAHLPSAAFAGLSTGAVPKRADARDAFCARDGLTVAELPEGARVGVDTPLRLAQLRSQRADLDIRQIHGSVTAGLELVFSADTAQSDRLDAIVVAAASLGRLGRLESVSEFFELSDCPTTPGQGALVVEVREGQLSRPLAAGLAAVNHVTSTATVLAERLVHAGLESQCAAPIGATAVVDNELLFLTATVYSLDGARRVTASHAATPDSHSPADLAAAARDVADRACRELLDGGAADLAPRGTESSAEAVE